MRRSRLEGSHDCMEVTIVWKSRYGSYGCMEVTVVWKLQLKSRLYGSHDCMEVTVVYRGHSLQLVA